MVADALTKSLPSPAFIAHRKVARGTRTFRHLHPHTEFSSWPPGFSTRGNGSIPGFSPGGDGSPSVGARSKCSVRPDPGDSECHILGKENSWTLPDPGNCHVLEKTTSWKRPRPGNYPFLEKTTSWKSARPRQSHILGGDKSWNFF